jgi:hypothetical protein
MSSDKIVVENINTPGRTERLDRAKYMAMREALMSVLPEDEPGMTVPAANVAVLQLLPDDLFPMGATAGWWLKAVQLDLEAKGIIRRAARKPVHLYKTRSN